LPEVRRAVPDPLVPADGESDRDRRRTMAEQSTFALPADRRATAEATNGRAGKYLTFALAKEEYGLEILKVREIMGMMNITAVPRTPDFVKGVINLRGKVIPVIDQRLKFGMEAVEQTEETCIIVVDVHGLEMGIIVDRVLEVLDIGKDDIGDAPSFGIDVNTEFILGMGKADDRVIILLDIGKVLSQSDKVAIGAATARASEESSQEVEIAGPDSGETVVAGQHAQKGA